MSKLYTKYLELKNNDSTNIVYIFKSGIFYIFLEDDAQNMSKLLNLKLTNLNEHVQKCGFPSNNLSKYVSLLNHYSIEFKIIDNTLNQVSSLDKYLKIESINTYLDKIKKLNMDSISPKKSYEILNNLNILLKEREV